MDTNHSSYLIGNTDNNYQEDEYYQEADEEVKHEEQPFTNRDRINKIRLRQFLQMNSQHNFEVD